MVATNRHRRADGSVPLSVDIIALAQTLQAYQEWVRLAVQIDPKLKGRSWYRASEGYFSRRLGEACGRCGGERRGGRQGQRQGSDRGQGHAFPPCSSGPDGPVVVGLLHVKQFAAGSPKASGA